MPGQFDDSWSAGPFGPYPFIVFSQTDKISERDYVLGALVGGNVYQVLGAVAQYANASPIVPPIFRRTLFARVGARGAIT